MRYEVTTIPALAKKIGVSETAVRKWIKTGKLQARRIGGVWVIPLEQNYLKGKITPGDVSASPGSTACSE